MQLNGLGYLPAPYIYGTVYQYFGSGANNYGMIAIQSMAVISSLAMLSLLVKRHYDEKREKEKHRHVPQGG